MIRVRSEDPEKITFPELSDCIHYKQEKTFSDEEYNKAGSLQRAVTRGKIVILDRQSEKSANFNTPVSVKSAEENRPPQDLSVLFEYLKSLESKIDLLKMSDGSTVLVDQLLQKIESLEKKLQVTVPQEDSGIKETAKKLEELLNKMSNISGKSDSEKKELVSQVPEAIYVPNVKVEDGNSHINLKMRTVEKSDDLSNAAEALRKLKNKST
jgi:hypothetical protein